MKCQENKLRLLLVEHMLLGNPQGLSMKQIISRLQQHNITSERKAIYGDLIALNYIYDVQYKNGLHTICRLPRSDHNEPIDTEKPDR